MKRSNIILYIILIQIVVAFCTKLCDNKINFCQRGLQCFKKNETVSICRKRCPMRWACFDDIKNLTKPNSSIIIEKDTDDTTMFSNTDTKTSTVQNNSATVLSNKTISIENISLTTNVSTSINATNDKIKCDECPENMQCFHVENKNYTCAIECDQKWTCFNEYNNQSISQNNTNTTNTTESKPMITEDEFNDALFEAGYYISSSKKYNHIVSLASKAGNITTKRELAMFLAQILWESDGLKAVREYACVNDGCPNDYKTSDDVPGKTYYGRGYIQLTWAGNYKAASYDLFNDDRLYKNPDLVAEDEELSWATAFWYWKKHVKPRPGVELGYFGETTDAINGKLECFDGPNVHKAKLRFQLYKKILKGLKINEEPIEKGCYPC